MAPLGISLVNLLIESSSVSFLTDDGRRTKSEQEFAQNSSSFSSQSQPSPPSPTSSIIGDSIANASFPSSPTPICSSSSPNLNNNNYFSGTRQEEKSSENNFQGAPPPPPSSQKLYSQFWEKFKKSSDLEDSFPSVGEKTYAENKGNNGNSTLGLKNTTEAFEDKTSSSIYQKFYEKVQQINKFQPFWSALVYPSDLHYYGRVALMTVVAGLVIEKTLESLPDIEQLTERYGQLLHYNVLDGSDPNYPGKIGLDKDFF